ncbi:protein LAZ1 [Tanacetum coccineum]|uniref:Protein LAZ1 n=1 Tax=Tanacetum coccineum TaxID=301880 RepID=A0ABQ5GYZ2_9ASTR
MSLSRDKVTKVPVWVKVHQVPIVAYSEDGLSIIVTQLGKPIMLDAFTNAMCAEPWGRLGFARALIEVMAEKDLKKEVTMAIPIVDGEGHTMAKIDVAYEWKPARCTQSDGFTMVQNGKKKGNTKKGSGTQKDDSSKLVNQNPFDVLNTVDNVKELGKTSGDKEAPKETKDKQTNLEYESELEEMVVSENQLNVCVILESHVEINTLANVCNDPRDRRVLWADLKLHKRVVSGLPWVLLGDFNVALNMKDICMGSSSMNSAMCDFKDYELDEVQKALDHNPSNSDIRGEEVVYVQAVDEAKIDEERFLRQIAKIDWLEGEATGLFNKKFLDGSNMQIIRPITNAKIKTTMFDIGEDKASGPDVYTSMFLKKGRDVVGADVCKAIHDLFSNGKLLNEINHTFMTLIPKIATPQKVNDYRPISCCNVIYKCISKIITNHIKEVVSENQSAFVLGRRIFDNILLKQELMHNYHLKRGSPRCGFKVDIQKAYDMVDWRFLGFIFKCFGFHSTMIKWIMACVMLASFSICINGNVHGYFRGKRGLRQGDPLSTYLFTLVMEILTLILKRCVRTSESFKYHKHCEELSIINVCFADDLFIFAHGDVDSAGVIMASLDEFRKVSGLVPSIPNSTAYFCNVLNHVKMAILNIMPFSKGELPLNYFGVPLISSRLLNRDCKVLVEKAQNRIGDWKNKSLSFAGSVMANTSVGKLKWLGLIYVYQRKNVVLVYVALSQCLTPRDIARERHSIQTRVADLLVNGAWNWPLSWLAKAPNLVWNLIRGLVGMDVVPPVLDNILAWFQLMGNKRTIQNIVGKILFAAASYFIWLERNNRLFKNNRRTQEELRDAIVVMVHLKLTTFRFKNKAEVHSLLSLWKMPTSFRFYG